MRVFDVIEFEVMKPDFEIDPWVKEWRDFPERVYVYDVLINGQSLRNLVASVEQERIHKSYWYGHPEVKDGYRMYKWMADGEVGFVEPFCCPDCGDSGCCTFYGMVHTEKDAVVWDRFTSSSIRDYGLSFRFERTQFLEAIEKLNDCHAVYQDK